MKFERTIKATGSSAMIIIPADLCKFLDLSVGTEVYMNAEKGKHGLFLSVWRKDQKPVEEVEVEDKTE